MRKYAFAAGALSRTLHAGAYTTLPYRQTPYSRIVGGEKWRREEEGKEGGRKLGEGRNEPQECLSRINSWLRAYVVCLFVYIYASCVGDRAIEIARPDITRPDNAAPDQTEPLEHG